MNNYDLYDVLEIEDAYALADLWVAMADELTEEAYQAEFVIKDN